MLRFLLISTLTALLLASPAHAQAPPPPSPPLTDAIVLPVDRGDDGFDPAPGDALPPETAPPPAPEPELPPVPVPTTRTIKGKIAYVRADGAAAIPRGAPASVRRIIAAANLIVGKPHL